MVAESCRISCGICRGSSNHYSLGVASFLYILFLNFLPVFQSLVPLGHKGKDHNTRIHSYIIGFPRMSAPLE